MDVRSTDNSLAVKRLELERTQPVNNKSHGTTEDRVAADMGVEEDQPKRSKKPKDSQEQKDAQPEWPAEEHTSEEASDDDDQTEEHILDVKV